MASRRHRGGLMRRTTHTLALLGACAALVAGCGDDSSGDSATGGQSAPDAKVLSPHAADNAKGAGNLCLPKDVSGAFHKTIAAFNKQSDVKATLQELPESADEQRNQLIQRSQAKSDECDVMGIDVIWTAEFASQGWIQDLSKVVAQRK